MGFSPRIYYVDILPYNCLLYVLFEFMIYLVFLGVFFTRLVFELFSTGEPCLK